LLYLRRERNKADDDDSYSDLNTEVTEVLQRSGRVLSRLDRL
jgi:hypothetical protein